MSEIRVQCSGFLSKAKDGSLVALHGASASSKAAPSLQTIITQGKQQLLHSQQADFWGDNAAINGGGQTIKWRHAFLLVGAQEELRQSKMGTAYDMQALKAYVRGPSSQNKADDTVLLNVSHSNLKQRFMELRFDLHVSTLHDHHYISNEAFAQNAFIASWNCPSEIVIHSKSSAHLLGTFLSHHS